MNKSIIVVGLSAASMAFITKMRSFDQSSSIIAFSAEKDFPYNRCFLADFLTGKSDLSNIELKPQDFFEKNNIVVHLNSRVDRIDSKQQQIFVGHKSYNYDNLFLGIGTRPLIPESLKNCKADGLFTFHTLQDMQSILKFIKNRQPRAAVVIGAGLNGIEAASSLYSQGIPVALIEAQDSILPGQIDQKSGYWVENIVRRHGVMIIKNHKVIEVCHKNGLVHGVRLETHSKVRCDMVIIAAGSQLNSELLDHTDIQLQNGSIIVNENMQTSVPNILAGGDICVVPDIISKQLTRSTTWPDAMLQGLCAATTLSLNPRKYPGLIGLRNSHFFGKDFYACGVTNGQFDYLRQACLQTDDALNVLFTQNEILKGFILIGDISSLSELKNIYLSK
ncbi:FAD-dependent oxidoreductase [Candidatus Dependentiae bacterium]|nr:FAD-dependent oxidoreductase [Candidatus Dependentiae bacterium]